MRLLIVEPDQYYHVQYRDLSDIASEIRFARDAGSAMDALRVFSPDLMIIELLLPDHSGYELLSEVEEKFAKDALPPIIINSRIENLEDISQSLGFGIIGYFVKGKNSIQDIKKLILNFSTQ